MPRFKRGKIFEVGEWWLDRVVGSPFWYGFRYDADTGRVCRESLGISNLEEAKLAVSAKALTSAPKKIDSFLAAILEAYFESVSDAKPSGPQARYGGRILLEFWGKTARASDVTDKRQRQFAEWSRDRGHSVAYISRNLSVLSAALRDGLGDKAPRVMTWAATIANKIGESEPEPNEWIPTDKQLAQFLDTFQSGQGEHVFRYCILALNTLARPSALLELVHSQVDRELGLISLNPPGRRQTKKRRPVVRIPATLDCWLEGWGQEKNALYVHHFGEPIARVRHTFKRKGADLGFPEITPYCLRHKMATELRARGVSREELAFQMGHKLPDLRTTDRYTKFDKRYLASAVAAIEEYVRELNKFTTRDLLGIHSPKLLPSGPQKVVGKIRGSVLPINVVGATGIEPVTPTMSR